MKIRKTLLVLIPIPAIIVFLFLKNSYVEFKPIVFDGENYKVVKVDSVFYQSLKVVLKYNHVKFKENSDNKILVQRSINNDREIIWNYTLKAMDTSWVRSHLGE